MRKPCSWLRPLLLMALALGASPLRAATPLPRDAVDPSLAIKSTQQDRSRELPTRQQPVRIDTSTPDGAGGSGTIMAGAIQVDGAPDLSPTAIAQAVTPFVGQRLDPTAMKRLLTAVSGVARARGYLFARSSVPPQTLVAGILRVQLDEGRIDRIETPGDPSGTVRQMLASLVGRPALKQSLERRLMLASDLPGLAIGKVSYEVRVGQGVLIVPVTRNRINASMRLDNRGSSELGALRASVGVDIAHLLGTRDLLSLQWIGTPAQPRELNAGFARYDRMVDNGGDDLSIYGSVGRTRSGSRRLGTDAHGRSISGGFALTHPLLRGRKVSLWLSAGGDTFAVDEDDAGVRSRRDRVTTINLSLNGFAPLLVGRLRGGVSVVRGLDIFSATQANDPLASRPGAGPRFTVGNAWANWTAKLAGPISAFVATSAQISDKPLLAIEQITIGGPLFGRAFDFSERAGDRGILATAELRAKLIDRSKGAIRWAQFYAFGDAGRVTNHQSGFGTGSLSSAGAGVRVDFARRLRAEFEIALPIAESRYATGDKRPRLSFALSRAF